MSCAYPLIVGSLGRVVSPPLLESARSKYGPSAEPFGPRATPGSCLRGLVLLSVWIKQTSTRQLPVVTFLHTSAPSYFPHIFHRRLRSSEAWRCPVRESVPTLSARRHALDPPYLPCPALTPTPTPATTHLPPPPAALRLRMAPSRWCFFWRPSQRNDCQCNDFNHKNTTDASCTPWITHRPLDNRHGTLSFDAKRLRNANMSFGSANQIRSRSVDWPTPTGC